MFLADFASKSTNFDYPGERSIFEHKKGNFETSRSEPNRCRYIKFKSTEKSALIQYFELGGFTNGETKMWIQFDPINASTLATFLQRKANISLDERQKSLGFYNTKNSEELKSLFKIIFKNNTFPLRYHADLNEIVATGEKARDPFQASLAEQRERSLDLQAELGRLRHNHSLANNPDPQCQTQ